MVISQTFQQEISPFQHQRQLQILTTKYYDTGTNIYASTQISTPNLNIGNNTLSTWATITVPSYSSFSDIAWSEQQQMFIATVGYNSQYLYSNNGTSWTIGSYGSPYSIGDNNTVMYIPELSLWAVSTESSVFLTSSSGTGSWNNHQ